MLGFLNIARLPYIGRSDHSPYSPIGQYWLIALYFADEMCLKIKGEETREGAKLNFQHELDELSVFIPVCFISNVVCCNLCYFRNMCIPKPKCLP